MPGGWPKKWQKKKKKKMSRAQHHVVRLLAALQEIIHRKIWARGLADFSDLGTSLHALGKSLFPPVGERWKLEFRVESCRGAWEEGVAALGSGPSHLSHLQVLYLKTVVPGS